jgi:membrane protein DedA with SNARE-associated domain
MALTMPRIGFKSDGSRPWAPLGPGGIEEDRRERPGSRHHESEQHGQIARFTRNIYGGALPDACEGNCKWIGATAAHNLVPLCDLKSRKGLAYLLSGIAARESFKIHNPEAGKAFFEMEDFAHALADFVRDHQAWAAPIVLVLAFGESLAFISLLIPAWGALVAIGALIGASGISFWPIWIAGGIGAALGDWVSYWFGYKYKEQVAQIWPLSRYPEILPRGEAFVKRWGVPSIFIGRFFGPLRASVPLAAGIFEMPYLQFQIANFVSALIWAAALLVSGDVIAQITEWLWRTV